MDFSRSIALLGESAFERLHRSRVILFGVGGVGSWCAESLVRTGLGHLTLVDSDVVAPSNLNRQLMATQRTIGRPKVEALRERLLDICPEADIVARHEAYTADTANTFPLDDYDFVIDAIDSLSEKANLILQATASRATLVSAMGAALKMDPTRVRVDEFWRVQGCPLARALRNRFRRQKTFPARKFRCVYSDELLPNLVNLSAPRATDTTDDGSKAPASSAPPLPANTTTPSLTSTWDERKAQINGSLAHVVAVWGFTLASLVVRDVCDK